MTEEKTQYYGYFSRKQLAAGFKHHRYDDKPGLLLPAMYYTENGNKIICTMVSRDSEKHETTFNDIQHLGKVYEYAGTFCGNLSEIETLNKEALK